MKAKVDKDTCIGCGLCAEVCSEVFQMDKADSVAEVKGDAVPPDSEAACRNAANDCPVDAISVE